MQKKEYALCFTGHRSEKLPKTKDEMEKLKLKLWEEIDKAIENGIDTFYFGACYGFDLLCADIVTKRKRVIKTSNPKSIHLIAVIPFEEQASRWKETDRELYYHTLPYCDEVITLHMHYKQGCYHERNRYIVDRCSKMICYYNGGSGGTAYTVHYGTTTGLEIINLYQSEKLELLI